MANKYAPIMEKFTFSYKDRSQGNDFRKWPRSDYAGIGFEGSPCFVYSDNYGETEGSIFGFDDSREGATIADGYYGALRNCLEMSGLKGEDVYPGIHLLRDVAGPVEELGGPEELLPIAYTQGSALICLALFGLRPGAIFLFWGYIHLIADSFDEFMHLLTPNPY